MNAREQVEGVFKGEIADIQSGFDLKHCVLMMKKWDPKIPKHTLEYVGNGQTRNVK